MKKTFLFIIFALLFGCTTEKTLSQYCVNVTISDGLPVQFFNIDCETFNEKEIGGQFQKCFEHAWECADEIRLQFIDALNDDYLLSIRDDEGSEILNLPFSKTNLNTTELETSVSPTPYDFDSSLTGWSNYDSGGNLAWSHGTVLGYTGAVVSLNTINVQSKTLYKIFPHAISIGDPIILEYTYYSSIYSPSHGYIVGMYLVYLDSFGNEITSEYIDNLNKPSSGPDHSLQSFTIAATVNCAGLGFRLKPAQTSSVDYVVDYFKITHTYTTFLYTNSIYNLSFIPGELGICDTKIELVIVKNSTPDEDIARTDALDIKDTQDETVLITYSNHRNYAGLNYSDVSPDPEFSLRIPAIFVQDDFPQTDEVLQLSNSRMIQLNAEITSKWLLQVKQVPMYLHKKILIALTHQYVYINGLAVVKNDAYEILKGNPRYPLKQATCLLTEKEDIQRNVL